MRREEGTVNRRRVLMLAVLVLLVLLVLFLIWWWFLRPAPAVQIVDQPKAQDHVVLPAVNQTAPVVPVVPKPALTEGELAILNLARNFAERYGSWSTDSHFQNLKDLYPRVTSRMQAELARTIAADVPDATYKAVRTKAINISITSSTASRASVTVAAQQIETDINLKETVLYKTLKLTMVNEGNFWFVDTATWN